MSVTQLRPQDLARFIDHTLLKPEATENDIRRLCREAREHCFKAVCVNPIFVRATREALDGTQVLTAAVVGFPLGANLSRMKAQESDWAVRDGASEIDMVIRIDLVKQAKWKAAENDIIEVVKAVPTSVVKVILETGLLTPEEIYSACQVSEAAGAAFVKTATGFLGRGATVEDIHLMRKACSTRVQIKASGGVKTFVQAEAMISAGATRLGTSSGVQLVKSETAAAEY